MINDLDEALQKAYEKASTTQQILPADIMLQLYGLYKQATLDYNHNFQYQNIDLIRGFKFNAWQQVSHLSRDEAKLAYIDLVKSLNL